MKNYLLKSFLGLLTATNLVLAEDAPVKAVTTGEIPELIALLKMGDDVKRNAAVKALANEADEAWPLLEMELKKEPNSDIQWWLKVALQECEENRTQPGQISATPTEAKGLQVSEACKTGDGLFVDTKRDDVQCWEVPKKGFYLYFSANNEFRQKSPTGLEIEVEYLDLGKGDISLDYDSTNPKAAFNGAYENHPKHIYRTNSGKWRTTKFHLSNARFHGSENCQTDFRFYNGGQDMIIRSVRVWPSGTNN